MSAAVDVLQIITSTDRRGAQLFAVSLEPELIERGLRVRTVALEPGANPDLDVPTLGQKSLGVGTLAALRRAADTVPVVVAHGSRTLPATYLATLGTGQRFVYRNIGDPDYWASTRARRWRTGHFLRAAAGVIALTDGIKDRLAERYGVSPERMTTIPQAVSPDDFPRRSEADKVRCRTALGIDVEARLAVCIGALSPEKDVVSAVRALASLPGRWHLVVAGDGPERERVEQEAASIGPGRVRLLGQVSDTVQLMAAADVLLLSSRTEGMPGVVIEAAMVGVPSVVTDVGFVREIVEDSVTGFVVPPGRPEALALAVLRCEEDLDRLGAAAYERATRTFSLGSAADNWFDVLSVLVAEAQGR